MSLTINLNGEETRVEPGSLKDLLHQRGIDPTARRIAIARNGALVKRDSWPVESLAEGDRIEIVRPLAGG
ncbi:sulfur carrier protein ThiS [Fodinicurvata sediminis]|uniref:sulfur carrier protein ThiS n=1 Tax=Fodinicurvata sediminis TaxID=1121832 RepID=UPI0003B425A9|nr:sulfur carrier protein ThiS [Fodinicurvata sediminis]